MHLAMLGSYVLFNGLATIHLNYSLRWQGMNLHMLVLGPALYVLTDPLVLR